MTADRPTVATAARLTWEARYSPAVVGRAHLDQLTRVVQARSDVTRQPPWSPL